MGEVDDGATTKAEMNLRSRPGHCQIGESRKAPTPFNILRQTQLFMLNDEFLHKILSGIASSIILGTRKDTLYNVSWITVRGTDI